MIAQAGVVFGKNWARPGELSSSSKITALAAAKILEMRLVEKLFWTGGHTAGPKFPSESKAMFDFARENGYADLVLDNNHLEEESLTTRKNIKNIKPLLNKMEIIAACTTKYHLPRAVRILRRPFRGSEMTIIPYSSEEILEKYGNYFEKKALDQYLNSKWVEDEKKQEPKIDLIDKVGLSFALDWVAYFTRRG
jgi:hypothetical protein